MFCEEHFAKVIDEQVVSSLQGDPSSAEKKRKNIDYKDKNQLNINNLKHDITWHASIIRMS